MDLEIESLHVDDSGLMLLLYLKFQDIYFCCLKDPEL